MGNQPRQYRPGSRHKQFRNYSKGQYVDERIAWIDTAIGQVILMKYPEREEAKEAGPTVKLLLPQHGKSTLHLDLSFMNSAELDCFEEIIAMAIAEARPVVELRDRVAQDAFDSGDGSYSRSYRQVPRLVVRPWKERADDEGVQHGPSYVSAGDLDDAVGRAAGGVRGPSSGMADDEPQEGQPEDDGQTPH